MPMGQVAGAPRVRSARGDSFAREQRTIGLTLRRPLRLPVSAILHRGARGVVMRAVVEPASPAIGEGAVDDPCIT